MDNNVTELRPGAKLPTKDEALPELPQAMESDPPPNSDDPQSNIQIECSHLLSTVNLLMAGIQSGRIELREHDMRAGTVVNALWSIQYGLDRIEWLADRL